MFDPFVEKVLHYRALLHAEMPPAPRRTLEWLLVCAVREHTGLDPYGSPWGELEIPEFVAIANDVTAKAIELTGAQFGNLQIYVASTDTLVLVAHRNFGTDFVDRFACLKPDGRTACSRACASRRRVIIKDVSNDDLFTPHKGAALAAGFRSVQSTPLLGTSGETIGVLSTHFATPRSFSTEELSQLDSYAEDASSQLARAGA